MGIFSLKIANWNFQNLPNPENALGNEDFRFLIFVATDGVGRVNPLWDLLNAGAASSAQTLRVTSFGGFGRCGGNGINVFSFGCCLGGLAGLNGFPSWISTNLAVVALSLFLTIGFSSYTF